MNHAKHVVRALKLHYGEDAFKFEPEDPFKALISGILSQRTRDENTSKATERLFNVADTPEKILGLNLEVLKSLIKPSGYYNQKAKHIVGACKAIVTAYGGYVPKTREELMKLPGVGPKTADIVLSYGYGHPSIAVDTHILRVSRRLRLVDEKSTPEDVKQTLENSVTEEDWGYTDGALIRIGKDFCRQRKPKCKVCVLLELCEFGKKLE